MVAQSQLKVATYVVDTYNPLDGVLGVVARDNSGARFVMYHPSVVAMRLLLPNSEAKFMDVSFFLRTFLLLIFLFLERELMSN